MKFRYINFMSALIPLINKMANQAQTLKLFLSCFGLMTAVVYGQPLSEVERLQSDLLTDYKREFRPRYNQSHAVDIYTGMDLVSIQEFNEVLETIKVTAVIYYVWSDERLVWDPTKYGGAHHLIIQVSNIWVPHLILANSIDKLEKPVEDWHLLYVQYNGSIYYWQGNTFSATCRVDVSYYPWDRQVCPIYFNILGYLKDHVRLKTTLNKVRQTYYNDNGAWSLQNTRAFVHEDTNSIVYKLYLDRKPRFVVVNVIIPIIIMCFLNILVFLIPSESGERVSYCITMFLALAVFLTLVSDNLPKTSNPMSIFSYYLMSVVIVSMFITMGTIFNLNIYHKDEKETVSGFYLNVTRMVNCRRDRQRSYKQKQQTSNYSVVVISGQKNVSHGSFSDKNSKPRTSEHSGNTSLKPPCENCYTIGCDRKNGTSQNAQNTDINDFTWSDVSSTFDRLFFVFFVVSTVVITMVFMSLMWMGESEADFNGNP